jgi:Putative zinc-finger
VTEIAANGSGAGAPHEEFVELCALSTAGSLTPEEAARLCEHLLNCPSCRKLKRQYESVIKHVLPVVAAESNSEPNRDRPSSRWSLEQAETSLMARLEAEQLSSAEIPSLSSRRSEPRQASIYLLAALVLLCCGGVLSMIQGSWRHSSKAPKPIEVSAIQPIPVERSIVHPASAQSDTMALEEEISHLRAQLRTRARDIDQLNIEKSDLQRALAQQTSNSNRNNQQLSALEQQLASAHFDLVVLEDQLNLAEKQGSETNNQIAALESEIANLHVAIEQGDRELAEDDGLLAHDRDIRDLIGARNLYIAEIYDVAKTGATQKPFGRVFYTQDKSLIFYGYDLDQQPGLKDASTFQAWGRSGSSEHDVSLGLFYQDDASKKRWILKCNDARTLARLDAVFVTVEPKGGSAKPTGKPLLFTYLRLEPNHP